MDGRPAGEHVPRDLAILRLYDRIAFVSKGAGNDYTARARVYADSGRLGYEALLRANPRNDQGWGLLGLTLAYLGRYDDAIVAAGKSLALRSPQDDKYGGVYNELQLARVYAIAGRLDRAEAEIEQLLKMPSFLSPGWFRIDPTFAALRGRPRFERLVNGSRWRDCTNVFRKP